MRPLIKVSGKSLRPWVYRLELALASMRPLIKVSGKRRRLTTGADRAATLQ